MAALAGIQGGIGVPGVGSLLHPHLASQHTAPLPSAGGAAAAAAAAAGMGGGGGATGNSAVPQMVLTSGHVTQGVQGAQLLIPTSQGIAVQPILTIPLGQAGGGMASSSSLVNPIVPLHHLHHTQPAPHQPHTVASGLGSSQSSSNTPTTNNNSNNNNNNNNNDLQPPSWAALEASPSLLHAHAHHNNNTTNNTNHNRYSHRDHHHPSLQHHHHQQPPPPPPPQQQQQQHLLHHHPHHLHHPRSSPSSSSPSLASRHPSRSPSPESAGAIIEFLRSRHGTGSAASPLPATSGANSPAAPHPLLGLASLPPSLIHAHHHANSNNNNNNNSSSNNNISNNNNNNGGPEKPKLPLPLSSPDYSSYVDAVGGLGARLGGTHYPPPPASRYSPDFLDNHNQPTISQTTGTLVDGVNLDEIKEFAKAFKIRRLSLGLTQTQVGQALSITEGPAYSQSAICRFEKLDITPKSAQKIKPVLERWMQEAEDRYKNGQHTLTEFIGSEPTKKRKRRTSFTPQALEVLNAHFERNTHPSGAEITALAEQLGYEREVVRIWFCNKRQALKNTVRMMAKSGPPPPPPPPPHQNPLN